MKVYVAGPITKGDQAINVRQAIDAAHELLQAGHTPFVPHLTWFWHLIHPADYEDWMAYDDKWLCECDAIIRLPGESAGADREMKRAGELGLLIWEGTVKAFIGWHRAAGGARGR